MSDYQYEKKMYPDIERSIETILEFNDYEFEICASWERFSPHISSIYSREIAILGNFAKPDFMVLYNHIHETEKKLLIIEAKLEDVVMQDIAQAKIYGDIFNADSVMLVSQVDLRQNIKTYSEYNENLLRCCNGTQIKFVQIRDKNLLIQNAFPVGGDLF